MSTKASTQKTLRLVISSNEDYEWYPTTDEILSVIQSDMHKVIRHPCDEKVTASVLDCGAGDGRSLNYLTSGKKYAIEKSSTLIESMDPDIFIVGTEFNAQVLLDKKVDVVFSNPPYSCFDDWATKIITEANSKYIYLVIPTRWKDSKSIQVAIESRKASAEVLGTFDFLGADRSARAIVDILRVSLVSHHGYHNASATVDPFELWFDKNFMLDTHKQSLTDLDIKDNIKQKVSGKIKSSGALIESKGLIYVLEDFYHADLESLMHNYKRVCELDTNLLLEIGVNTRSVKETLKLKITSLKDLYWNELINNMSSITNKLSSTSRKILLKKLLENTHVDFNAQNAHAIVMWVIKNANEYFDSQLIDLVVTMTEKANVVLYKSNQRTFRDEQWRYNTKPDGLNMYKLDFRVVLERVGGVVSDYCKQTRLSDRAADLLDDICTVAYNIGFDTCEFTPSRRLHWDSRVQNVFTFNGGDNKREPLFEARAFYNGNLHIKFNAEFMCRLNVEFGRLKGWLKTAKEASEELGVPLDKVIPSYGSNLKIEAASMPILLGCAC
jgi:hypothetical protein